MINESLRILVVYSQNSGKIMPFVVEQVEDLKTKGCDVDFFPIIGKGMVGYLKNRRRLLLKIKEFKPDVLHAHFGLSGLLANLQRKIPVVSTYHGCDINTFKLRIFSLFSIIFSKYNIFVSQKQVEKVKWLLNKKYQILPCGINLKDFYLEDKNDARIKMGLSVKGFYILFSSSFDRKEKNPMFAKNIIARIPDAELIELKGYSREEVKSLMNACDVGLMTSIREGSPMFVKEMLACRKPVVSTNVGDVEDMIGNIEGCYIIDFDIENAVNKVKLASQCHRIEVPAEIEDKYNSETIAENLIKIYHSVK